MPLSGEAKKLYQRRYMRLWRAGRPPKDMYEDRYCRICGYSRVVDNHHLDGNHDNNEKDNLLDLCPNCHALITRGLVTLNELLEEGDNGIEGV